MKDYKMQLKSWYPNGKFDANKFEYDALNGNIDVFNAEQINQKATQIRKNTITRSTKMRMARIINATKRNPHMHRIVNVWYMGQIDTFNKKNNPLKFNKTALNYINTKSKFLDSSQDRYVILAQKGKLLNNFSKKWNKYNPEKIVNPKQDNLTAKSNMFNLEKYPQIKSRNFKEFLNHNKYFNGIKETVAYVNDNHMNNQRTKELLSHLNIGLHKINTDMKYTIISKRMQSAHRYTSTIKRHRIKDIKQMINMDKSAHDYQDIPNHTKQLSHVKKLKKSKLMKKAYAYKYGIGNDRIDVDSSTPVVTPLEDGEKKFRQAVKFIRHINKQTHTDNLLKSVGLSNPSNIHSNDIHHHLNHHSLHTKVHQRNLNRTSNGRTKKIRHDNFQIN